MKYTLLKSARRELRMWHWPEQLIAFLFVVFTFAIMGPFETYSLPLTARIAFWGLSVGAGWIAIIAALMFTLRHPMLDEWHGGARVALAVGIAVFPIALVVWNVENLIRPDRIGSPFWQFLINVGFVCGLIASAVYLRVRARLGRMTVADMAQPAPFFDRLPFDLGRNLISLSMQDHYVEATTDKGTTLILLRFSDAIDELGDTKGAQIHRSHWIAQSAFRGLERDNGKLVARLSDDRRLPVSRTYAQTVRALTPRHP